MYSKFRNQKGVTLAELLVAIAILGILVAIGSPSFSEWVLTSTANSAVNTVATELILARTKAISQNSSYIVTFYSPTGGPYKVEIHDDKNNDGTRDSGEQIRSVTLPTGIQFGANAVNGVDNLTFNSNGLNLGLDNAISFGDRGYASETGAVYLIPSADLSSPTRNDRTRAVGVLQATGSVKGWNYRAGAANPGPWE